jgi:hypothetical protein
VSDGARQSGLPKTWEGNCLWGDLSKLEVAVEIQN